MFEFKLPDVGEGMHEAEIVRWLVKPGDTVKVDQVMLEIQTDKALVEIPSPVAGLVAELRVEPGQLAHVGDILITFETEVKAKTEVTPNQKTVESHAVLANTKQLDATASNFVAAQLNLNIAAASRVRAAPAVRKRALELNVDLTQVQASSPDGRVLLQDVLNYVEQRQKNPQISSATNFAAAPNGNGNGNSNSKGHGKTLTPIPPAFKDMKNIEPTYSETGGTTIANLGSKANNTNFEFGNDPKEERKALVGLRRRIAERMEMSWRTIPHVTTFDDADGEQLVALRKRLQPTAEKRGVHLTYLPLIVKAVVQSLKQHPIFNSSLDEQTREIIYKWEYHIGLATATSEGLIVPVIRHADKLTILQLAIEIIRLTEGARNRSLKAPELGGSTFTISNFGSFGAQRGTPIINPPEAAILGMGKLADQAVARHGQVVVRPILPLALSFDHRLIDGADAGAFSKTLVEFLENPDLLMLDMI
jgi:pyruvate dehydrogenase E2 component (dihydrolipoamide acetyltransferase)